MALYLLIWGEAANIRFLPECLCYIFHHMADEMYDLLEKPRVERSEKIYIEGSQHSFLEKIICPIHEILAAESDVPAHGRAAHSAWRNYDDFNEFFWAPSCFELSWPWRLEAGFFLKPKKDVDTDDDDVPEQSFTAGRQRERKLGKTHFVEHRTFLHVYHSFHRLWIFLVCMLQGLTIFAFCNQKLDTHSIKYILSVGSTFIVMRFVQCKFPHPRLTIC
jgi:callose synthase